MTKVPEKLLREAEQVPSLKELLAKEIVPEMKKDGSSIMGFAVNREQEAAAVVLYDNFVSPTMGCGVATLWVTYRGTHQREAFGIWTSGYRRCGIGHIPGHYFETEEMGIDLQVAGDTMNVEVSARGSKLRKAAFHFYGKSPKE